MLTHPYRNISSSDYSVELCIVQILILLQCVYIIGHTIVIGWTTFLEWFKYYTSF